MDKYIAVEQKRGGEAIIARLCDRKTCDQYHEMCRVSDAGSAQTIARALNQVAK